MRAVVLSEFGGPENLSWQDAPTPKLRDTEVRIDVAAAALNRADVLQRMGFYPPPPGASETLGLECSGVISEVAADVTDWSVGQEVCALLSGGGYAEQVCVPAGQVMPLPPGVDLVTAASIPEVACTVWSNVTDVGRLRSGQLALLHGGAGGIGTFGIQYAKALGATVAVTAGSQAKLDICQGLGADIPINYKDTDFVEVIRATGGANVILDNMGAKYLERNIKALAPDGHLVIIGMQGGTKAELNLANLIGVRGSIHTTSLRSRGNQAKARICKHVVDEVWPLFAEGKIKPVVDSVIPISDVAQAHQRMEDSTHVGKMLLQVR